VHTPTRRRGYLAAQALRTGVRAAGPRAGRGSRPVRRMSRVESTGFEQFDGFRPAFEVRPVRADDESRYISALRSCFVYPARNWPLATDRLWPTRASGGRRSNWEFLAMDEAVRQPEGSMPEALSTTKPTDSLWCRSRLSSRQAHRAVYPGNRCSPAQRCRCRLPANTAYPH
jgi:hypothetical protein